MPDMMYSPALKAQQPGQRPPVEGTIPRGYELYPFEAHEIDRAGALKNPLQRTKAVLERGQLMFNTYCMVCHGAYGEGDGSVVPKYPRPPSLQSEKILGYPDGKIFHVITRGQNLMPSYASQIARADRWAIIHYIRAIQKAKNPTAADLKAANEGI
jgi:mono/diheme cytochrome c family protein